MCVDFASWNLQEGLLAHCSNQTVSFSNLNKISPLGDAASIPLWIPKAAEAVRHIVSRKQDQLRRGISHQVLGRAVAPCSRLVLVWRQMPPAATKMLSSSWELEPWAKRPELGPAAHRGLRTSYQGSPEPVCAMAPLGSQSDKWSLPKITCADLGSVILLRSSFLDVS